ncbi:hypothetical protein GCM10007972_24990 [Iodidimonas muriae]|uniref:HTH merR-type domain-containing protein n=1 Tax=Iodidimonas muriae TaxID=261467 RepID=A0ABQ2LGF5_9PROT|nr:hypothetical protein GCM10007972_24990 [Iodidimonas muriae]
MPRTGNGSAAVADGKAGHEKADHEKSDRAFRTIGEVSELLDLPQHVLRFWETRFTHIRPLKRGGNRRYYRPADIDLLCAIKTLLYEEGITIKGVQKRFREQGVRATVLSVLEPSRADEGAELANADKDAAQNDARQDSDHGYPEKAVSAACEDASSGEDGLSADQQPDMSFSGAASGLSAQAVQPGESAPAGLSKKTLGDILAELRELRALLD